MLSVNPKEWKDALILDSQAKRKPTWYASNQYALSVTSSRPATANPELSRLEALLSAEKPLPPRSSPIVSNSIGVRVCKTTEEFLEACGVRIPKQDVTSYLKLQGNHFGETDDDKRSYSQEIQQGFSRAVKVF